MNNNLITAPTPTIAAPVHVLPAAQDGVHPAGLMPIQPAVAGPPKTIVLPAPKKTVLPPLTLEREIRTTKHESNNSLAFHVKSGAGILFSLLHPPSHAFEPPDITWLKLLEAIALIPSGQPQSMVEIIGEVNRIIPFGEYRNRFQSDFRNELYVKSKLTPRDGLALKDKVNRFLRAFLADPIQGYVTTKTYIHNDLYTDDVICTPFGKGFVRAYRSTDKFYVVTFPWGHGYLHESCLFNKQNAGEKRLLEDQELPMVQKYMRANLSSAVCEAAMRLPPDQLVPKELIVALADQHQNK